MNRDLLNTYILAWPDAELQSEISYFVNDIGDREYAYDALSALVDIEDRCEMALVDGGMTKVHAKECRRLLRVTRDLSIKIDRYRVMPQEEIDNTYRSSGTKWNFKIDGVAYTTNDDFDHEQFPEEA